MPGSDNPVSFMMQIGEHQSMTVAHAAQHLRQAKQYQVTVCGTNSINLTVSFNEMLQCILDACQQNTRATVLYFYDGHTFILKQITLL